MEKFRKAIEQKESILARVLDVDGELLRQLRDAGVITEEQREMCQHEVFCSAVFAFRYFFYQLGLRLCIQQL